MTETAHAKINLGLKILGLRQDGYHEIRSIMQTVTLADTLHFSPASETGMSCTDPDLSTGADNLVMQAAGQFQRSTRTGGPSYHIHVEKRVPQGAGLGGGSADAAAVLRGLNHLAGNPMTADRLRRLGDGIGSDVPFAISGGTALVSGRGEVLEPLHWEGPSTHYVLVDPGFQVSTAWAYGQPREELTQPSPYLNFTGSLSGGRVDGGRLSQVLENDLKIVVERANPIVVEVEAHLVSVGATATSMSGSGSTIYGIFDDRNAAGSAATALTAMGFRSFCCTAVARSFNW